VSFVIIYRKQRDRENGVLVIWVFFLSRNFVSGLICTLKSKQESRAIAKKTARYALHMDALKNFGSPWLRPWLLWGYLKTVDRPRRRPRRRERGRIQGLPKVLKYPLLAQERVKLTNFKFCTHFHTIDYNKSPLTISGKVAMGVAGDSRNFSGHPYYRAHRVVFFAIARLSCMLLSCS